MWDVGRGKDKVVKEKVGNVVVCGRRTEKEERKEGRKEEKAKT